MNKRKEYLFYGYNCPGCGEYYHNGYTYTFGEDYRNAKRYKEYLDCGFNMVQARGGGEKGSEYKGVWEASNCKKVFDEFLKAGGKRVLVTDLQFEQWIRDDKDLVGEGKRFANESELDEAVKERVFAYCNQKGFYGIQLFDEPQYMDFPAYGQLVRSLKRVLPGVYLQCNLLPISASYKRLAPPEEGGVDGNGVGAKMALEEIGMQPVYEKYVNDFITATGLDYVLFDEYPFRREYIISGNTLPNYQIVGRICQKRNLEFRVVLQSFVHFWNGALHNRYMCESDMYWQTNLALGFGGREFSFYTYFAKPDFDYKTGMGESDGGAFINLDGSKTALYFYTKRIIAEMKKFSKIGLKYSYQNSWVVTQKGKTNADFAWTRFAYENEKCPLNVEIDKGVALITEQNAVNGNGDKLYMFENFGNVRDELFDGVGPMQVCVELPKGKKNFYFRGKKIKVKADKNGKYTLSLKVGDAVFVEVKNN